MDVPNWGSLIHKRGNSKARDRSSKVFQPHRIPVDTPSVKEWGVQNGRELPRVELLECQCKMLSGVIDPDKHALSPISLLWVMGR